MNAHTRKIFFAVTFLINFTGLVLLHGQTENDAGAYYDSGNGY